MQAAAAGRDARRCRCRAAELAPLLGDAGSALAASTRPALCVVSGPSRRRSTSSSSGLAERRGVVSAPAAHLARLPLARDGRRSLAAVRGARPAGAGCAAPRIPFVSNVTGTWITEGEATDPALLGRPPARDRCASATASARCWRPTRPRPAGGRARPDARRARAAARPRETPPDARVHRCGRPHDGARSAGSSSRRSAASGWPARPVDWTAAFTRASAAGACRCRRIRSSASGTGSTR